MSNDAFPNIGYDQITQKVTIHFRGERIELPNSYRTQEEGMKAGKAFCRGRGWPC
jgi:hypothetical protein